MACVPSGKKGPGITAIDLATPVKEGTKRITAIDLAYQDIERIGDRGKTPCYEGSRRESCKSIRRIECEDCCVSRVNRGETPALRRKLASLP
jgi:hypothetical protein